MSATTPAGVKPGFRFTGWHMLAGVVTFFAVVIAVDVLFTVLALRTFPGQVSVTPYEDGLLYNQRIAQQRAQAALGWRAAATANAGVVTLTVQDAAGSPIRGLDIAARLERPATEAGRLTPKFIETAPGRYEAATGRIAGAWDLTAEASDTAGRRFVAERRLTWP
ncbi:FixH family protein [Phenylobacterium sp.]|jgi:nitrogen fixation protein FixH|uniref:FixH family protein n=1 Tax=Phenylobacterium sp. TaxID=1871053 RepID=UPI003784F772